MRPALLYFAIIAVISAQVKDTCRPGFTYYQGWCIYTYPFGFEYQQAVDECTRMNAFAPSIHNQQSLDFWRSLTNSAILNSVHFWLDCYCPTNGRPYTWKDGTPTDWMGPRGELLNCQTGSGYHMHPEGFEMYKYNVGAAALCAYDANAPVYQPTVEPTTPEPTTSEPTTPEATPVDVTAGYCSCNPSSVYLDIVFVVDASADMTSKTVGDATAAIQSTLIGLTFGTDYYQSNVAVVAFADKVQTVRNFGGFRSDNDIWSFSIPYLGGKANKMAEAITQASSLITSNERAFTRGLIVLMSKSFNQLDSVNIGEAAEAFKNDGGIFITIDYAKGQGIKGLKNLASNGYYINDASSRESLNADILYSFCDANCFCSDGLYPYNVPNEIGRELPMGCYHIADVAAVFNAAEQNCLNQKGFVATIHDNMKNFFIISVFPPKARFWIGLKRTGNKFEWSDGSIEPFTDWAPGNPVTGMDCVYKQQQSGFNALGYSASCTDPLKYSMAYACQLRPCDSEYNCWK